MNNKKAVFGGKIQSLFAVLIIVLHFSAAVPEASGNDSYIQGYASAILEREFNIKPGSVRVEDGVVYINDGAIAGVDFGKIMNELSAIQGVRVVEIVGSEVNTEEYRAEAEDFREIQMSGEDTSGTKEIETQRDRLFDPLIADPRWPSFSANYQFYIDDDDFEKVFAPSIGDVIPLYTADVPFDFGGRWQLGGEAAAFVVHDHETTSWDQVNADYLFGLTFSYRKDSLSGIFRVFHFSSHIGDEYLLNNDVDRENYSYEALGLTVSKDLGQWIRLYGGGEYRFSRSPKSLDPLAIQYGSELKCPLTFGKGLFRPVAALDVKHMEDNNWDGNVSLQAGVKLESEQLALHNVRFMLGYYNGHSPNGQFYQETIKYWSLGMSYNH